MRRLLFCILLLALIAAGGIGLFVQKNTPVRPPLLPTPSQSIRETLSPPVSESLSERLLIIPVSPSSTAKVLYSNHPKYLTDWLTDQSGYVINGGYFDEDYSPSGYLVAEGTTVSKRQFDEDKSGLLLIQNGKISLVDLEETPIKDLPKHEGAIQSYPFLIKDSAFAITKDSGLVARRTAVGIDTKDQVYIIITDEALSLYAFGELLTKQEIPFETVLNLDGGPSTGILVRTKNEEISIPSYTPIPSVLIILPEASSL